MIEVGIGVIKVFPYKVFPYLGGGVEKASYPGKAKGVRKECGV